MKLVFDHKIFHHINQSSIKETGRASKSMLLAEKLLQKTWVVFPLGAVEHLASILLTLPIPVYSTLVYWLITNLRGLPHFSGMYFRALYYRRKLGAMEPNVFIDQGVFFAHPENVYLSEFCYIDKNVMIMSKSAKVGRRVHIAPRAFVSGGGDFVIDDYAGLATNVSVITSTEILKDGARCGGGPMISAHQRNVVRSFVHVKKDAFVAVGVTILPGVTVGEGSVAGAGITLSQDTEAWGVYVYPRPRKISQRAPVRWEDD